MILAPDKRFIFIHVPKAAGTSINSALSLHDAFHPVRNHSATARAAHAEKVGLPEAAAALGEHATARDFIRVLGAEAYAGYYSFAFVRNPWDVAVSWFHYRLINPAVNGHKDAEAAGSFTAYIKKHLTGPDGPRLAGVQYPFVLNEAGEVAVSFIGRYESLQTDYGLVKRLLKIDTLELDHFNQSYHPAWPSLYTRETFDLVGRLVAKDAQLFGYAQEPAAYGIT